MRNFNRNDFHRENFHMGKFTRKGRFLVSFFLRGGIFRGNIPIPGLRLN